MAVLLGGLRRTEHGLEFYRVAPGGATEVAIQGDDRVRLIDRHGGQTAELTARGGAGLAALGLQSEVARNGGLTVFGRPFGAIEFMNSLEMARRYEEWAWLTDHRRLAALCKAG